MRYKRIVHQVDRTRKIQGMVKVFLCEDEQGKRGYLSEETKYRDSKPHGAYRAFDCRGRLLTEGDYADGKKQGKWKTQEFLDATKSTKKTKTVVENHVEDQLHGPRIVVEGPFKTEEVYDYGRLLSHRLFRNDRLERSIKKIYDENGTELMTLDSGKNPSPQARKMAAFLAELPNVLTTAQLRLFQTLLPGLKPKK